MESKIGGNDVSSNMTETNMSAAAVFVQTNERENKVMTFKAKR